MKLGIKALTVAALASVVALYACRDTEEPHALRAPSAIVAPSFRETAPAPFDIVPEGNDLIMTGDRPLRARFASEWTSITRKYDGAKVSFRAASIGRATQEELLPASAAPRRFGDRVELVRDGV